MIEIELKFKLIGTLKDFREKMIGHYVVQPRTLETTMMYDNKELLMQKTDGRLRIRSGQIRTLSYKKPLTRKGIKQEIEYEVDVSSISQTKLILNSIGFQKVSGYTRHRTIWRIKGSKVFLDEFSFGNFVEIEGSKKEIKEIAKELWFDLKSNITKSYDGIYNEMCLEKGIKPKLFI